MNKQPFVRELRYVVIKWKDAMTGLTPTERRTLKQLCAKCAYGRVLSGKPKLECVVVESDWPEYEPTWAAIEARMIAWDTDDPLPASDMADMREVVAQLVRLRAEKARLQEDYNELKSELSWEPNECVSKLVVLRSETAQLTKERDFEFERAKRLLVECNRKDEEIDALRKDNARLREVMGLAQATLTALNVGDIKSGSPLHLKLREVLIEYRAALEAKP